MARRVNTKFVIVMGSGLVLIAGAVVGYMVVRGEHNSPAYLEKEGDAAMAKNDLPHAEDYYARAGEALSQKSRDKEASEMFSKVADLAMKLSATAGNEVDAAQYYRQALSSWNRALTEDQGNLAVREKWIEELYKTQDWSRLKDTADQVIKVDPKYPTAYGYYAEACLHMFASSLDDAHVKQIEDAAKAAMAHDPSSSKGWVVEANLLELQAGRLLGGSKEREQMMERSRGGLRDFLAKHANDADAAGALASEELNWVLALGRGDHNQDAATGRPLQELNEKERADAIKVLEAAFAEHRSDVNLARLLAVAYSQEQQNQKSEETINELVKASPRDAEAYMSRANYYMETRRSADAIASFQEVLAHPEAGGGIAALRNISHEADSLFGIAWCWMDVAEMKGLASAEGAKAFAQARDYANRFRGAPRSVKAKQDLLDGRMLLMSGKVESALTTLERADAVFSGVSSVRDSDAAQWRRTKQLLSVAYRAKTEWGLALTQLDTILQRYPTATDVVFAKASILMQIAKFKDALTLLGPYADPKAGVVVPAVVQKTAWQLESQIYSATHSEPEYLAIMQRLGGVDSTLAQVNKLMQDGDNAGALAMAKQELDKNPDNEALLAFNIMLNKQLGNDAESERLLKEGLAKHPESRRLQSLSIQLANKTTGLDHDLALLDVITDPYTLHMARANRYGQVPDRVKQIAELKAAAAAAEKAGTPESSEEESRATDMIFELNLMGEEDSRHNSAVAQRFADAAKDPAAKAKALKDKADFDAAAKGCMTEAEVYMQRAEQQNLDGVEGRLYKGRWEFAQGGASQQQGIDTVVKAVADRPNDSRAHLILGIMYNQLSLEGKAAMSDKALEEFREAIQQKPDNAGALRMAIELLIRRGELGNKQALLEADTFLKQALQFAPRDPQLQKYADLVGETAEAIRKREAIRKATPDDMDNLWRLSGLYVKNKEPEKALEVLNVMYKKYPDDLQLASGIAELLKQTHRTSEAQAMYEKFIGSGNPEVSLAATLYRGDMYKATGDIDKAIEWYKDGEGINVPGDDGAKRRLAELYFGQERMPDAEGVYRDIYAKDKDTAILSRLVETLLRQKKFKDADTLIGERLAAKPDDADGLLLRGSLLVAEANYKDAIDCFNRVLKADADPNHPNLNALYERANAEYQSRSNLDQAIQDLVKVREGDPNRVMARFLLARTYRLTRQFGEASVEYEAVIALAPDAMNYRIDYAQFLQSVAEVLTGISNTNHTDLAERVRVVGAVEKLQKLLDESLQRFPDQPIWLLFQAKLLAILPGGAGAARQKYREAFNEAYGQFQKTKPGASDVPDPSDSPERVNKRRVLMTYASAFVASLLETKSPENYHAVVDMATGCLKIQDYGDFYMSRMIAYAGLNQIPPAMADFDSAAAMAHGDWDLYLDVVEKASRYLPPAPLMSDLQAKLVKSPEDGATRMALAKLLTLNGDWSKALGVLEMFPADPKWPHRAIMLRIRGLAEYQTRDPNNPKKGAEAACADYEESLKLLPGDLGVLNNLAFILAEDVGKPKEALGYVKEAMKIMQGSTADLKYIADGNMYDTYGWVEFLCGDMTAATNALNESVAIEPTPVAYYHRARVWQKLGKTTEARNDVQQGLHLSKVRNDAENLRKLEALEKELGE